MCQFHDLYWEENAELTIRGTSRCKCMCCQICSSLERWQLPQINELLKWNHHWHFCKYTVTFWAAEELSQHQVLLNTTKIVSTRNLTPTIKSSSSNFIFIKNTLTISFFLKPNLAITRHPHPLTSFYCFSDSSDENVPYETQRELILCCIYNTAAQHNSFYI